MNLRVASFDRQYLYLMFIRFNEICLCDWQRSDLYHCGFEILGHVHCIRKDILVLKLLSVIKCVEYTRKFNTISTCHKLHVADRYQSVVEHPAGLSNENAVISDYGNVRVEKSVLF